MSKAATSTLNLGGGLTLALVLAVLLPRTLAAQTSDPQSVAASAASDSAPQRDPQELAILNQSLDAMGRGALPTMSAVNLTGQVTEQRATQARHGALTLTVADRGTYRLEQQLGG